MTGYLLLDLVFAIFFIGAVVFCLYSFLQMMQQREQQKMLCALKTLPGIELKSVQILDLPAPLERYFHQSRFDMIKCLPCLEVQVSGFWQPKPGSPAIPVCGDIYYSINRPCFMELFRPTTWPHILKTIIFHQSVNDGYIEERFFSVLPMRRESGSCIRQMGLIKYFFQSVWFPWILHPSLYLNWEHVDERTARFTVSDSLIPLEFIVKFNESGLIEEMRSECNLVFCDKHHSCTKFIVLYGMYCDIQGLHIPQVIKIFKNDASEKNLYQHLTLVSYHNASVPPFSS